MSWGVGKVMPPAVTDPIVVDGTKYRIRSITWDPLIEESVVQARTTIRTSMGGADRTPVAADLGSDRRRLARGAPAPAARDGAGVMTRTAQVSPPSRTFGDMELA